MKQTKQSEHLDTLRHSAAHVLAHAVKELYPECKLGIGPPIEDGFYYDFDKVEPFTPEDLIQIEQKMKEIVAKGYAFEKEALPKEKAVELFTGLGESYKVELIKEIREDTVTIYKSGEFLDLCRGPHAKSTSEVKAFKLLSIAGAYWHGSEVNPMLQRIYGTAFEKQDELDAYLRRREEARKRDHRKLGKELELFGIYEIAGPGLIFYHPKGAMLRAIIEDFIKKEHLKRGYEMVIGPHVLRSAVWVTSGHYDYYKENMYTFKIGNEECAVKPMNCPAHILIYQSKKRSYRELPIRYFELGTVYRHEKSGVLHGLLRVRGFTQDDAHLFCTKEQLQDEVIGVIDFVTEVLNVFGFEEFAVEISTRPPKYIGKPEDWDEAQAALEHSLQKKDMAYTINEGEGAFYGPKIDIKLKDALKREWQCATIQCDFALPERFGLTYVGSDGKEHRPIMLHRVILGSLERFIGALIEHYGGNFPLWLAPIQVALIPVSNKSEQQMAYLRDIKKKLDAHDIRVTFYEGSETMNYKVRDAQAQKIAEVLVIGDKEVAGKGVSVRRRGTALKGMVRFTDYIKDLKTRIDRKSM
jgi:threonyl-tRNA synthetase